MPKVRFRKPTRSRVLRAMRGATTAFADQAIDLAQRSRSPASIALAHMAQIGARYLRADLLGAEEHFVRGNELFAETDFRRVPGSVAYTFGTASLNAWSLGRADIARERIRQAIAGACENNSPYEKPWAQSIAAELHLHLREPAETEALAEQVVRRSDEHGFAQFASAGRVILGLARANLGQASEGVILIRQGLSDAYGPGSAFGIGGGLTALACAQALDGSIDEALTTIEQAHRRRVTGPRRSGYAANSGSNLIRSNSPRPTSARRSRSRRRWARRHGSCARR